MPIYGAVVGIALATAHFQAGQQAGPSPPEEPNLELLLLDVLYDHLRLETALAAWQDGHLRRYLPLRQLSNALGFRVHVEPAKRTLVGFLGDPGDRIALNGLTGRCVHKGKPMEFDPSMCFEKDNELYLDADLVTRFTGLHFAWTMTRLELEVTSDSPLPIRQQWIQRQLLARSGFPVVLPQLPIVRSPYSLLSIPSLQVQWYSDAAVQQKVAETASRLQIEGHGDLLFMSARYRYISASSSGPAVTLLTLGREDPHGGLLGSLHATQFSFGDLNLAQVPLFARSRNGLGASVSNFPLAGSDIGGPTELDGHSLPRSTVEMYRGSELLATVKADDQGHYVFGSVPLESGPNDLRIVVITPDGDVQEEQRTLYGDSNGPRPGQGQYRLTAARVGDSVIPQALAGLTQDQSSTQYIGEYRWGVSSSSWLAATAADAEGRSFMGLGLHSWTGSNLWHFQTMFSGGGGGALSAGISHRFSIGTLSLEQTIASSAFGADLTPELGTNATELTRLRFDGSTRNHGRPIGYGLSVDRVNGSDPSTTLRARVNGGDGRTFVSNTVGARISGQPMDVTGLLQARRQFGSSVARFDLGYGFGSEKLLQSMRVSFDRRISDSYRMRLGLDYDASRLGRLETTGALYKVFGPLELGFNLALDFRGALKANLLLSVGMEGDSGSSIALARPGSSESGSVVARAFLDKNCNGKLDGGDLLLPRIGFKVGGRFTNAKTGADGSCLVDRLASNQEITLSLNDDTFEDPCWASATPGVLVIPRTGHPVHVDLAVIESAEISGKAEGIDVSRAGLTAELINSDGKVVNSSVLDESETYVFSQVRPGNYTMRLVDPNGQVYGKQVLKVSPGALLRNCDVKVAAPKSPNSKSG